MISWLIKKFSGRHYRKFLERCRPVVARINEIEVSYQSLTDEQLRAKTDEFRDRVKAGETLDALLPEAFAAVKNAARRLCGQKLVVCEHELEWNMVHFDVQLIGGMAIHEGRIAEMATGEGKTLVSTLPLYLNALNGRNAQLVTVNDYLARRDSEWMGYLYNFLGLTVGCIQQQMPNDVRREMYSRDITYGTASEFGFDYLRDNGMATRKEDQVQREHWYCIVDEIDSILVDEARTPLIISGPAPIEREQPFTRLKPGIERLAAAQTRLCNNLVAEARELLEKTDASKDDIHAASLKMLQVKFGAPNNKQLLRLLEQPEWRKLLDKVETELHSDFQKSQLYALKEELYYSIDERQHQADLSLKGRNHLRPDNPDAFVLPDLATQFALLEKDEQYTPEQREDIKRKAEAEYAVISEDIHAISQLLRAYSLYEKDVEYVVQEGKVMIVDENTGRVMPGRRWSDGLHQAIEAKENVAIENETRTYATITIQNYFRMYEKLAGMTGTAETEATEFNDIYKLSVQVIPTNRPCIRIDKNDSIYKTRRDKYNAVVREIEAAHKRGQPVLVGTASVESSEVLSRMLKRANIVHTVLNAKFHAQEADIVARAGQRGAVTIATNMAGRGTDIKLGEGVRFNVTYGPHEDPEKASKKIFQYTLTEPKTGEVKKYDSDSDEAYDLCLTPSTKETGGLYVIGTERHQSRRVDRQLRGRCSRQGDPGLTKFFLSLEDELMRLFLQGNLASRLMEGTMKEGEELQHPLLNRSIESAQKKVEQQNFSARKRLLQYDDVLNLQRQVVYDIRNAAIHADRAKDLIFEQVDEEIENRVAVAGIGEKGGATQSSIDGLVGWVNQHFRTSIKPAEIQNLDATASRTLIVDRIKDAYAIKESAEVPEALGGLERYTIINAIDQHWQEHLTEMESLRQSVSLRSYGQKDPLVEYKNEAYKYFEELMDAVRLQICTGLFRSASNLQAFENMLAMLSRGAKLQGPENAEASGPSVRTTVTHSGPAQQQLSTNSPEGEIKLPKVTIRRETPKVGRNDPCPCGSGKKYKNCHGGM
ncbi:preprotein translocase subunit SecA [Ereboglobus sp. PH5-5]|uniref:preprotein translocase subunit SecA n=1 Tax=Ereboglobus sp. PH5-5 TaxID=2940529 RepID=UPI002406FC57|nr:preprotein translocase subunit SecA [Ereboglobus sp. PH5-5]MDF9833595.1 preprotein translocase subunit SecA [Ereboglobus sp. PH5-5]